MTAKADDKATLEKLAKLTTVLAELRDKESAVVEEMAALLAGRAGIGDQLKSLYSAWNELWSGLYGEPYVFSFPKDAQAGKRLLRAAGLEEVTTRAARFLGKRDAFFVQTKHSFGCFVTTFNQHVATQVSTEGRLGLPPVTQGQLDAVAQAIDVARRRQEMTAAGMSPAAIEAVFEAEYEARLAARS